MRKKEKDGTAAPCPEAGVTLELKESGAPWFTEVLYPAGVLLSTRELPSCDTLYITSRDMVSITGTPLPAKYRCPPVLNRAVLYLVVSEAPGMTPETFLAAMWAAGVTRYTVDMVGRTVTCYGGDGCSPLPPQGRSVHRRFFGEA